MGRTHSTNRRHSSRHTQIDQIEETIIATHAPGTPLSTQCAAWAHHASLDNTPLRSWSSLSSWPSAPSKPSLTLPAGKEAAAALTSSLLRCAAAAVAAPRAPGGRCPSKAHSSPNGSPAPLPPQTSSPAHDTLGKPSSSTAMNPAGASSEDGHALPKFASTPTSQPPPCGLPSTVASHGAAELEPPPELEPAQATPGGASSSQRNGRNGPSDFFRTVRFRLAGHPSIPSRRHTFLNSVRPICTSRATHISAVRSRKRAHGPGSAHPDPSSGVGEGEVEERSQVLARRGLRCHRRGPFIRRIVRGGTHDHSPPGPLAQPSSAPAAAAAAAAAATVRRGGGVAAEVAELRRKPSLLPRLAARVRAVHAVARRANPHLLRSARPRGRRRRHRARRLRLRPRLRLRLGRRFFAPVRGLGPPPPQGGGSRCGRGVGALGRRGCSVHAGHRRPRPDSTRPRTDSAQLPRSTLRAGPVTVVARARGRKDATTHAKMRLRAR